MIPCPACQERARIAREMLAAWQRGDKEALRQKKDEMLASAKESLKQTSNLLFTLNR